MARERPRRGTPDDPGRDLAEYPARARGGRGKSPTRERPRRLDEAVRASEVRRDAGRRRSDPGGYPTPAPARSAASRPRAKRPARR